MSAEQPPPEDARPSGDFARGMMSLFLLHLLQIPMSWLSGGVSVWFIGVTQFVYVLPVLIVLTAKKQPQAAKGLCTAAGITFLLNATCSSIFFWAAEWQ